MARRYEREDSGGGGFLAGMLAGTVLGAAAALLLAQQPGSELRHDLAERAGGVADAAKEKWEGVAGLASAALDTGVRPTIRRPTRFSRRRIALGEWRTDSRAAWKKAHAVADRAHRKTRRAIRPVSVHAAHHHVSLEAIFLTLFVLASENRLTQDADRRGQLDLRVNLLAEQEMTMVLRTLKESMQLSGSP